MPNDKLIVFSELSQKKRGSQPNFVWLSEKNWHFNRQRARRLPPYKPDVQRRDLQIASTAMVPRFREARPTHRFCCLPGHLVCRVSCWRRRPVELWRNLRLIGNLSSADLINPPCQLTHRKLSRPVRTHRANCLSAEGKPSGFCSAAESHQGNCV